MRFVTTIAAAGVTAMLGAGAAQALPSAMVQPAVDTGAAPQIELVRAGCGFGEHRSYYGRCHYNRGIRGFLRYRRNHFRHRYY